METTAPSLASEVEVRALLDSYFDAVRAQDLERIVGHYAPDFVAYDAVLQLEFTDLEAYKAHWQACLEMCQHMVFEPRRPIIVASDELGVAYCLISCGGTTPEGKEESGWARATFAARKVNGRWLIVHEHYSMPFDPGSGKIIDDLEPRNAERSPSA